MFFVNLRKYRVLFVCILCTAILTGFIVNGVVSASTVPSNGYTIVVDAGHGGMDGGTLTPDEKYKESDINLTYAKALKTQLENCGFRVVLTRTNEKGLYTNFGRNYKEEDMAKRRDIIMKEKPDVVISMHTNFFTDNSQSGAQVFYQKDDEKSKTLAENVQLQLEGRVGTKRTALSGDFYICSSHPYTSIICECGFLSNEKDVENILSEEYRKNYCYAIACGVISYLINPITNANV